MLRQKQHEIMLARLEVWKVKNKIKTPAQAKKPPMSKNSMSTDKNRSNCGRNSSKVIRTPRQNIKPESVRKEQRLRRDHMAKMERQWSTPGLREHDVCHQTSNSCHTMREKLEEWLREKRKRMAFERSKVKIAPWNSNKRKLPVSRVQWQSEANIKLGDIETSKYLGNYGPAKVRRSTPGAQGQCVDGRRRKMLNVKENVSTGEEEIETIESNVDVNNGMGSLSADVSHPDSLRREGSRGDCTGNESKAEKDRRDRLDEWLRAKGKTPHSVRRSVRRRETFDVVSLSPDKDNVQHIEKEMKRNDEVNITIDECLQSCLEFMNEMKCESKVGDWLQELHERCPQVKRRALFWVCLAKVAEHDGLGEHRVLALFEDAIDNNAKPTDILKSALQDFTIRHSSTKDTTHCATPLPYTPRPVLSSAIKYCNTPRVEKDASSVVRYCLVESTPIIDRFNDGMDGNCQRLLVTPVRRSVRIEKSISMSNLGNRRCVASLQELPADMKSLVMMPNRALEQEFTCTVDQ